MREWDDPPPETCCHDEDKCEIKHLGEKVDITCIEIDRGNVSQRVKKSGEKILEKINDLLILHNQGTDKKIVDLEKWNNLKTFIEDNFTQKQILESNQSKLIESYNLL